MSLWLLTVLACACGGALVLWNEVSRSKHFGTQMLKQYETLLSQAREEKQKPVSYTHLTLPTIYSV